MPFQEIEIYTDNSKSLFFVENYKGFEIMKARYGGHFLFFGGAGYFTTLEVTRKCIDVYLRRINEMKSK